MLLLSPCDNPSVYVVATTLRTDNATIVIKEMNVLFR